MCRALLHTTVTPDIPFPVHFYADTLGESHMCSQKVTESLVGIRKDVLQNTHNKKWRVLRPFIKVSHVGCRSVCETKPISLLVAISIFSMVSMVSTLFSSTFLNWYMDGHFLQDQTDTSDHVSISVDGVILTLYLLPNR